MLNQYHDKSVGAACKHFGTCATFPSFEFSVLSANLKILCDREKYFFLFSGEVTLISLSLKKYFVGVSLYVDKGG